MKTLIVAVVVLGTVSAALFYPARERAWYYDGVGPAVGKRIAREPGGARYVMHDGELYLLSMRVYSAIVVVTGLRRVDWSDEQIQELRKQNPEIDRDSLWDEPDTTTGELTAPTENPDRVGATER